VELQRISIIAVVMIALALAGLLVSRLRNTLPAKLCWWFPLALIPLAVLFLQLHISLPVWNLLPKLRFLQFPWRWLVVLEAPMAIFIASAIWPKLRWRRVAVAAVCGAVFLAASVAAGKLFFQVCDDEDNVLAMTEVYRTGAGFQGTGEYSPPRADNSLLAAGLPTGCLVSDPTTQLGVRTDDSDEDSAPVWQTTQGSCETTYDADRSQPQHLRIIAVAPHAGFLILRLRSYPAWQVEVNGQPVSELPRRSDGLIAVPVPQETVNLTVDWTTTPDVIAGRWISLLAVLLLTALCLLERKLNRPRLS
jgi:hypothetical protein